MTIRRFTAGAVTAAAIIFAAGCQSKSGEQVEVPRSRVVSWLHEHLGTTHRELGR